MTWVSAGATSCTALWTNSTSASGSQIVFPATTATYSILCTNSGSTASATTTVTVLATTTNNNGGNPTPSVSLTANPGLINQGGTSSLSWTSSNTTYCTAGWTSSHATSGSQDVTPATTTSYAITCGGQYGTTTATTTVTVNTNNGGGGSTPTFPTCGFAPQAGRTIVNFSPNEKLWNAFQHTSPKPVNLAPGNYKVSLHSYDGYLGRETITQPHEQWFVKFFDTNSDVITTSSKSTDLQDMIMETAITEVVDNSLTLIATATAIEGWHGPYPDVSNANSVNPVCAAFDLITNNNGGGGNPTPSITLSANPSTINSGASSTLSWTSQNTTYCSAAWTNATSTSGSQTVSPASTTSYGISCGGQYGTTTATTTVTVNTGGNGGGGNPTPSITLSANPSTINTGASSTLSWTSSNTTYCSAGWTTATTTSGTQDVAPGTTTDYAISCGGQYGTTTATTTVTVNTNNNGGGGNGGGGGGGGGGGIGGHRHDISNLLGGGQVLGSYTCDYLHDYLRIDWVNDPVEVMKVQSFLNIFQGEELSVNGTFDQATFNAVSRFQNKYFGDILEPWGHTSPTGFVYILTKKKVNEIYCNTIISLTPDQQAEILAFHSYLVSIGGDGRSTGYASAGGTVGEVSGFSIGTTSSTSTGFAVVESTTSTSSVSILLSTTKKIKDKLAGIFGTNGNAAISIFAFPGSIKAALRGGLQLLGILALIYAITSLLFSGQKNKHTNEAIILPAARNDGKEKKNEKLDSQIEEAVNEELSSQPSDSH